LGAFLLLALACANHNDATPAADTSGRLVLGGPVTSTDSAARYLLAQPQYPAIRLMLADSFSSTLPLARITHF
jgi:hypothetical protein